MIEKTAPAIVTGEHRAHELPVYYRNQTLLRVSREKGLQGPYSICAR
jgi:hypothetical protein